MMLRKYANKYLLKGTVTDFNNFPLRIDFHAPDGSVERYLFEEILQKSDGLEDVNFLCELASSGERAMTNTLTISGDQQQMIGLEEKLFGPSGSSGSTVYVNRDQMTELAAEMYTTLNIVEDYDMPQSEFSEAFVDDMVNQLAIKQFQQVSVNDALETLSHYAFDISQDLKPDVIKHDMSSVIKIDKSSGKDRIVLDEDKYNKFDEKYSGKHRTHSHRGILGIHRATEWAKKNSHTEVNHLKTRDEQLHEMNQESQDESQWEFDGDKVVPKSLNVAELSRSKIGNTLSFSRVRIEKFVAPFERQFTLYASRILTSISNAECYCYNGGVCTRVAATMLMECDCPVQFTGDHCETEMPNLAIRRPAVQSSTYRNMYFAELAVDGITDTTLDSPHPCSHNGNIDYRTWWAVNLYARYHVSGVKIVGRATLGSRLEHFEVGLTNVDPQTTPPLKGAHQICGQYPHTVPDNAIVTQKCAPGLAPANWVFITTEQQWLTICEIYVYGRV
jgi:hypothetical protein